MQNCKWTAKLVTLGIVVVALANSLAPSKAQAQENFAWITDTNGVTWKQEPNQFGQLWFSYEGGQEIAEIVVPEHANITDILASYAVNLTNIVIHPVRPSRVHFHRKTATLLINSAFDSGLLNITCHKTMLDHIILNGDALFHEGEWAILQRPVRWTELPKMEIRTHSTDNGPELEIVWREGNLQIADTVSGEWKDYSGNSPLRIPLAVNSKPQQFFRIRKGDD